LGEGFGMIIITKNVEEEKGKKTLTLTPQSVQMAPLHRGEK